MSAGSAYNQLQELQKDYRMVHYRGIDLEFRRSSKRHWYTTARALGREWRGFAPTPRLAEAIRDAKDWIRRQEILCFNTS